MQNRGVGARLMQDAIARSAQRHAAGVRLLQSSFHNRTLCLYTKLGFRTREAVSILQGKALGLKFPGYEVRSATAADVAVCNRICHQVHGFDRGVEWRDAIVFAWCLEAGLKLVFQMTLMTTGLYHEPDGAYLPSVLY